MLQYRLRSLILTVTVASVTIGAFQIWREYKRGARDRGFIVGVMLAIDEGRIMSRLSYLDTSISDYERGVNEGLSYVSVSFFETTRSQREALALSRLMTDLEMEKNLKKKVIEAIND